MKPVQLGFFLCSLLLFLATPSQAARCSLNFIGDYNLPHDHEFAETKVNGLSGMVYDSQQNLYYLVSDDRSKHGPARVYVAEIALGDPLTVRFIRTIVLRNQDGKPFAKNTIDFEGIALLDNGNLLISGEGVARRGIDPSLTEFSQDGDFVKAWPVAPIFAVDSKKKKGIRNNLGFESLTASPDGQSLFLANEAALYQDGEKAGYNRGSLVRIVRYHPGAAMVGQHPYRIDPLPITKKSQGTKASSGLVDLLALNQNILLSLERSYIPALGKVFVKIYETSLENSMDISEIKSLSEYHGEVKEMKKELVLDLDEILDKLDAEYRFLDNLEGISFGPRQENGSPTVLLVSDGNFNFLQRTLFLAFALNCED